MKYETYLEGLMDSIIDFNSAKERGVKFSRYEFFDYMFKKELSAEEGFRKRVPHFKKKLLFIKSVDYRIACFYAKFFSSIMRFEKGYSFSSVKKEIKDILSFAYDNCICLDKFRVAFKDNRNVLYVVVSGRKYSTNFSVEDTDTLIKGLLNLVSLLGSWDEKSESDRVWFKDYLIKEYKKSVNGEVSKPYADVENRVSNFKSYLKMKKTSKNVMYKY